MPTLSQYWFHQALLGGPFDVCNVSYPDSGWAWIAGTAQSAATLAWNRPDNEQVIDMAPLFNTPSGLNEIDALLGDKVKRTSPLKAQARFYWQVPYYSKDPSRHGPWDMLVRLYLNFFIGTPWYCTGANGNVSYYIMAHLDGAGHLQAYVDGWSYEYDGGQPFCTGSITDALNSAVPGAIDSLQSLLDNTVASLDRLTFTTVYLLPGSGTKVPGSTAENADMDVAIATIP